MSAAAAGVFRFDIQAGDISNDPELAIEDLTWRDRQVEDRFDLFRRQTPIWASSTSRPSDPLPGQVIFESDTRAEMLWTGSAWVTLARPAWGASIPYTPTVSNWTQGNGTTSGWWRRIGRRVHVQARFAFGSTSVASATAALVLGAPTALPIDPINTYELYDIMSIRPGVALYGGVAWADHATGGFTCANPVNAFDGLQGLAAGIPLTWAAGDLVDVQAYYNTTAD